MDTLFPGCAELGSLAAGWSIYAPSGSEISFDYFDGRLTLKAKFADNADLVMRTFVAYESKRKVAGEKFLGRVQTPDGLFVYIYEQLWCPIIPQLRLRLESAYAGADALR